MLCVSYSKLLKLILWCEVTKLNWCTNAVGADADDDMLELLVSNAKGKDISELIASGKEKMASALSGCGGRGGGAVEVKIAEKVEEKEEEVAEQEDDESDDVSF